jgi:hypothetical protein
MKESVGRKDFTDHQNVLRSQLKQLLQNKILMENVFYSYLLVFTFILPAK